MVDVRFNFSIDGLQRARIPISHDTLEPLSRLDDTHGDVDEVVVASGSRLERPETSPSAD